MQSFTEIAKDIPVIGGVTSFFFAEFDNLSFHLLNITDFNLSLNDALSVWEALIRTTIGALTIIVLLWRIKNLKQKNKNG
jgi:hypothetical protein